VVQTNLVRIGDKVIDRDRILRTLDRLLELRKGGASQAEAASAVGIDRSFVSRLENLGEVRKGDTIALVGFPISNCDEIKKLAEGAGVDFVWLMNDRERWEYVQTRSGIELLNDVVNAISHLGSFDHVVFLGSDMRVRLVEAILGPKTSGVVIGESPIRGDVYIDPEEISALIEAIRGGGGEK
jgi:transcriptional regulator with XRE-family HTH domain